jgi:hypothetical protein
MLEKTFNPAEVEARHYQRWEQGGYFASHPDSPATPFTIMMPPPNVTGSLHIGHALTFTLQDVLVRYERMRGRDVLWQPGTDHDGIATQSVVERQLAGQGSCWRAQAPRAMRAPMPRPSAERPSSRRSGSGRRNPAAPSSASCAASAPRRIGRASASPWTRA